MIIESAKRINELLDYDKNSGVFTWKKRNPSVFVEGAHSAEHQCAVWNACYAGKCAGATNRKGYRCVKIFGRSFLMHRLAWLSVHGVCPAQIDHVDGNRANNALSNLRLASQNENAQNRKKRVTNRSGLKGVYKHSQYDKWVAAIGVDGQKHYLGVFGTQDEAYTAYKDAARLLHGEFARLD